MKKLRSKFKQVDLITSHFDLDQYFETVQPDIFAIIHEVTDQLMVSINSIRSDHFEEMKRRFFSTLEQAGIFAEDSTFSKI